MQISRLFETVYILLNRRHVTAKELAQRFEVSVRTIYRDIDALSQAGVPVYATQGAGGGIHISDAFVLNKSALTDMEQSQIILALQSLSATGHPDSDELLSRLGSLFNKDSADWIEVDFSRWGNAEHDRHLLATVKDGILHRRVLAFTYHSGQGQRTQREVYPVKLVYKSRAWYLQAFCRQRDDFRTFKLVRMSHIMLLDETFVRQTLPEPPPFETESTGDAPPPAPCPVVTIRFAQSIAWRVLDEFDPGCISWEDDGSVTVRARFPEDEWLYNYVLSFGVTAEVIAPDTLRGEIARRVGILFDRYHKT